jgi:hypothetical protein
MIRDVTTINHVVVNNDKSYDIGWLLITIKVRRFFVILKIIHVIRVMKTYVRIGLKTLITTSMVNGVNYDVTNDLNYDRDSDVKQQITILNKINILL